MSTSEDLVYGTLQPIGTPDTYCFESAQQFYESIAKNFKPAFSRSITNVVISNVEPTDEERQSLWIRLSNGGQYIGEYIFSGSTWKQISPVPNGVFRMYGDSRNIPTGYALADENNPQLTAAQGTFLKGTWHLDPTGTYYDIFDVTFEGI